jgi:hypothetical protein
MREIEMVTPKVDFMQKWKLEEDCFHKIVFKDVEKAGKQGKWPRTKPVDQIAYETWLNTVVDPESGHYYPKRDEEGKPIPTGENPMYSVISIVRYRTRNGKEYLLSKGYLHSYDSLGDPVSFYISYPERWERTNFSFIKDWDPKKKAIVKMPQGPSGTELVYTLEFNETNLKGLFDKRQDDYITWTVKDDRAVKAVEPQSNVKDTFKLFLKPFDYLMNAQYISQEMKAQYKQEAIDEGILSAPVAAERAAPKAMPNNGMVG